MESFPDLGVWLVDAILTFAYLLTGDEAAPGWVSLGLIILLAVLYVWHGHSMWRFRRAVIHAQQILDVHNGRKITGGYLVTIDRRFEQFRERTGPRSRLATAWREFRETTIAPEPDTESLANTERPAAYFNREELGVDGGVWRYVPAFFVSVGLLLTFLGLVAALDQTGHILERAPDGDDAATEGLKALLNIAGAKFIMSLTGLFCSIIFTLVLRYSGKRTDRALHELCADIEDGCIFLSEQKVMRQILEQAKEQTSHLQSFSTELVAQIAKPLQEDLPRTIRESIQEAIAPAMEKISGSTSQEITRLAGDVSEKLASGIHDAVQAMGGAIDEVRRSLEEVTSRLDQSTKTIETLTQSVQESATKAAEASGQEIQSSGRQVADAMRHNLLDPLNHLAERVEDLASQVDVATKQFEKYAGAVDGSTTVMRSANEELGRSAETLVKAADPVRGAVVGIESASRTMGDRVEAASEAMQSTTKQTEAVMRGAHEAIEASQTTVREGLDSFASAVGQFREIIERYKEIDRSLGDAFEEIESAVQVSIKEIGSFQRTVNEEFGKALNRLQAVIAQAEPFTPREDE